MGYGYYSNPANSLISAPSSSSSSTAALVALVCAIVGSILIFALFLKKDNEKNLNQYTKPIYNFLQFNRLCIESILKFIYLFLAIFITVASFGLISSSFFGFLVTLVVGNLLLRVTFELIMITILIHRNVRDINEKMKK